MLTIELSPFPILTTERLILRQIEMRDAPAILSIRSDEKVMQYIRREPFTKIEDAEAFIDILTNRIQNVEGINWGVTLKDTDEVIGVMGLWRFVKDHHRAELGYSLASSQWGKGITSEAVTAIIEYGFQTLDFHTIEAVIDPANIASQKVLEKQSFIKEGYFKQNFFAFGQFYDSAVYSLLNPNH